MERSPETGITSDIGFSLVISLAALVAAIGAAVAHRARLPDWLIASAGALLLLALGVTSAHDALDTVRSLGSTLGILVGLLAIAEVSRRLGLFDRAGALLDRRLSDRPSHLLAGVFVLASLVTFVLGLDATVVLVTPVVLRVTARRRALAAPCLYATAHLANSASLLLPISNLTNLLALHDAHIGFLSFAALMALPTAAAIAIEWGVLRAYFADALGPLARTRPLITPGEELLPPIRGAQDVVPRSGWRGFVHALQPGFLVFVVALAVIVDAAAHHGLRSAADAVLPSGDSLLSLLGIAGVGALLANAVNNLPATLILLPALAAAGQGPVLALLIGVGVGPNLTPAGSLATLLWRRAIAVEGIRPPLRQFLTLGALTALPTLLLATVLLWVGLQA